MSNSAIRVGALAALFLAAMSGCAGSAQTREVPIGKSRVISDPRGQFTTRLGLPHTIDEIEDGSVRIQIPLEGSPVPMYCFVLRKPTEVGASVVRIANSVFEAFRSQDLVVENEELVSIEAGAIGEGFYQAASISYVLRSDEGAGTGLAKAASANLDDGAISCNHADAGYAETFRRVFADLVGGFTARSPAYESFYREISILRINGRELGALAVSLQRDAEGDVRIVSEASMIAPAGGAKLDPIYTQDIAWSRPSGALINAYAREANVVGDTTTLALEWTREDGWHVQGVHQEKALETSLDYDGPLHSPLSVEGALRSRLLPHGDETRLVLKQWLSSSPDEIADVVIEVESEPPFQSTMHAGRVTLRGERDMDGSVRLARHETENGGEIEIERIYRRGDL
ncbi:MAG: hypothetical protein AAF430_25835 [Myxococcota bacterium]